MTGRVGDKPGPAPGPPRRHRSYWMPVELLERVEAWRAGQTARVNFTAALVALIELGLAVEEEVARAREYNLREGRR